MSSDHLSALIARVALRDRVAFRSLYTQTSAKLFGICLRILKDRSEAEDAVQEVYIKIWDNAQSFRAATFSPISWLAAVARNHAIDRLRVRKPSAAGLDDAAEIPDGAPNPERAALMQSERRRIDDCLAKLDTAEAIRGAYMDGETYQELAGRFRVPVNTMRSWLRRGLMRLKECLEHE
jgi:RNA polymerase sigma-70 factor, ECF subfamily